jgi:hypothetical protein
VIGTVELPSVKDPDVVFEYTQLATAGSVYGQYSKSAHCPVGAAATADPDAASTPTPITAAASDDRNDLLITTPLLL